VTLRPRNQRDGGRPSPAQQCRDGIWRSSRRAPRPSLRMVLCWVSTPPPIAPRWTGADARRTLTIPPTCLSRRTTPWPSRLRRHCADGGRPLGRGRLARAGSLHELTPRRLPSPRGSPRSRLVWIHPASCQSPPRSPVGRCPPARGAEAAPPCFGLPEPPPAPRAVEPRHPVRGTGSRLYPSIAPPWGHACFPSPRPPRRRAWRPWVPPGPPPEPRAGASR